MDPRSPKRRKTSPGGTVSAGRTGISGTPRRTPNRASFMSPTKASLSRFNPDLLPRPAEGGANPRASRSPSRGASLARGDLFTTTATDTYGLAAMSRAERAVGQELGDPFVGTIPPPSSAATVGSRALSLEEQTAQNLAREALRMSQVMAGFLSDAPGDSDPPEIGDLAGNAPEEGAATPAADTRADVEVELAADAGRALTLQAKIDTPSGVGDVTQVDAQEDTREKAQEGGAAKARGDTNNDTEGIMGDDSEPDLPLAPRQLDTQEEAYTPPRGVLYSSPAKRKRKPPKEKPIVKASQEEVPETPIAPSAPAPASAPEPEPEPKPTITTVLPGERKTVKATNQRDTRGKAKRDAREASKPLSPPPDPVEAQKRQEKQQLTRELEALQNDVRRYEAELVRQQDPRAREANLKELIDLVNKASPMTKAVAPPESTALSELLTAFLPFARPQAPLPTPPPTSPLKELPSHAPIELDDPLPYLTLFTPFTYTSELSLAQASSGDEPNQQHVHTVHIASPQDLLNITLSYTVDTKSSRIVSISVVQLPAWAEDELGMYIRRKAGENDMGAVAWALGSYWRIATLRAECWARCEREFSSLMVVPKVSTPPKKPSAKGSRRTARKARQTGKVQHGNKRRQARADPQEDTDEGEEEEEEEEVSGIEMHARDIHFTRKELMVHLGREVMQFRNAQVVLEVGWSIGFDWTGEAESRVTARAAFPGVWHDADERGSLQKVSTTFDSLVGQRGVLQAVRAMAKLLFGG